MVERFDKRKEFGGRNDLGGKHLGVERFDSRKYLGEGILGEETSWVMKAVGG